MDNIDLFKYLFAVSLGLVLWFLKSLITSVQNEIKELEMKVAANSTKIEILKSNHESLGTKIDEIGKDLKEISLYIRNLKQS